MKIILTLNIILILVLKGHPQDITYNTHNSVSNYGSFEIKYPSNWKINHHTSTIFNFVDPKTHGFKSNFNLTISNSSGNLQTDYKKSIIGLEKYLNSCKILNHGIILINGKQCSKIVYTHKLNQEIIKVILYQMKHKNNLLNITFSSSVQMFANNEKTFEYVIKSFKIN